MHVYLSEASEIKKPREYLASILLTTKLLSTMIKQDAHEPEWNRRYQEKMQEMSTIIYSVLRVFFSHELNIYFYKTSLCVIVDCLYTIL